MKIVLRNLLDLLLKSRDLFAQVAFPHGACSISTFVLVKQVTAFCPPAAG